MAATTAISWSDAIHNFWIGCTEVDRLCDGCYARESYTPVKALGVEWGDDKPRHRTSKAYWDRPRKWNAMHERGQTTMRENGKDVPVPRWVFSIAHGDFFDNVVPEEWRIDAWAVIKATPQLRWQLVTHRLPNVRKMLPADWDGGRGYEQVGIIATVVDQGKLDRDLPRLLALKSIGVRWVGLSIEPQLAFIAIEDRDRLYVRDLDWVIGGGESEQREEARPYYTHWAEGLIAHCRHRNIPYFQKQVGSNAWLGSDSRWRLNPAKRLYTRHPRGEDPSEWPPSIRVRQMPRIYDE